MSEPDPGPGGLTPEPRGDADELVARAIESVLEAVPVTPEEPAPEALARYQPWADTATPGGKNKRPLQALLDELAARVEAEPGARAAAPAGKPPMLAFFDRFGSPRREGEARPSRARRRRRRGGQGTPTGEVAAATAPGTPPAPGSAATRGPADTPPGERPGKSAQRRRRRRGRGRGGGGSGSAQPH
ncbi:MAG TPA: hypothetical protein VI316_07235 [Candidatus Dormibacteraeota bacterium]